MKLILLTAALTLPLFAERTFRVTWDKYPEPHTITIYQESVDDLPDAELGSVLVDPTNPTLESVEVTVNDDPSTLYAVAINADNFPSEKSDPLHVPAKMPPPSRLMLKTSMAMVEIQTSSNLADWESVAFIPLKTESPTRFIRANITPAP